jgi:hypothetical protein
MMRRDVEAAPLGRGARGTGELEREEGRSVNEGIMFSVRLTCALRSQRTVEEVGCTINKYVCIELFFAIS